MAFQLILSFDIGDGRPKELWGLIQKAIGLELFVLNYLSEVVLKYTTMSVSRCANNNIAQSNVVLQTGGAAADADHQTNSNIWKAIQHAHCYADRSSDTIFAIG